MSPKVAVLKPLSSAISIGSGGPFGAEGPIIMTGGAIGSLFAQCFSLSANERKTLLVAGATAGMTAIFGTPIAAVLLAVELLLFEWKPRSLIPVLTACALAAVLRPYVLGSGPLFAFSGSLNLSGWVPLICVGVGLVAGLQSGLLTGLLYKAEDLFGALPIHWMWWPALGGLAVGLGGLIEPRALAVGYDVIGDLLANHMTAREVALILIVKSTIWIVALASGTSGGVLAPLLIFGGCLGWLEGQYLPGDASAWALVGNGRHDGRHHALALDRRAVRGRADRQSLFAHAVADRDRHELRHHRPDAQAIDPNREDRAARPAHRA